MRKIARTLLLATLSCTASAGACAADGTPQQSAVARTTSTGGGSGASGSGGTGGVGAVAGTGGIVVSGDSGQAVDAADDACGGFELQIDKLPGTVLIVFDQSNTMGESYGAGSPPKWAVARDAITAALSPVASTLNAGAIFFPSSDGTCAVLPIATPPQIPIADATTFLGTLSAHFGAGFSTHSKTPILLALERADQALPDPASIPGPRSVVVLADGYAVSCGDPNPVVATIASMHARGIETYIVGLPGASSGAALLNQMAQAGGTNAYIEPANATQLQTELANIAAATIDDCTFTLEPPPMDGTEVHLLVDDAGTDGGLAEVPIGPDGWSLSGDLATATLEGITCTQAKAGELTSIRFIYGCPDNFVAPR